MDSVVDDVSYLEIRITVTFHQDKTENLAGLGFRLIGIHCWAATCL